MLRSFVLVSVTLLGVLCPFRSLAEGPPAAPSPTPGQSTALPYETTLQIGRPLHPVRVSLKTGSELTLVVAGKRRVLPVPHASAVTVEVVPIADGAVALLHVRADDGQWVGLVGGRSGSELLLFERAEPTGDPGERHTRELRVSGEPKTLLTGIRYEGVSLCGQRPAWFDTKRLDAATLTLQPDNGAAAAPAAQSEEARVTPVSAARALPLLSALAPVASSELDPGTLFPRAPRALVDGDLARGVALRGGFALLRWEGGALPIESFELAVHADTARTVELSWLGDREPALHASVPVSRGETRVVITPPKPLDGRCLALVMPKADGVELRELYAYTDLDRDGGLDRLVGTLVQDDQRASAAVDLLEKLGPAAAERVAARWDELSARGKRRGLKVLARALAHEGVRQRVVLTAAGDDVELRTAALGALERGGEPGRLGLRELAQQATPAGDLAAIALAAHPEEASSLLAALSREGGAARAPLRAALTKVASKDAARTREATTSWLATAPTVSARAALALAVARAGDGALAASLLETQLAGAQSFEERYRVALGLAGAAPAADSDAWLRAQAETAEEWMQRRAALAALVQRASQSTPAVVDKLAHDAYPRVRAEALAPLVATGQPATAEALLVGDPWPLVRVEAARALATTAASRAETRAALSTAIADRSPRVRRAAIEAVTQARLRDAWSAVRARLEREDEPLEVRTAGLFYVQALCQGEATPALVKLARKVLAPSATDDDNQLAVEALRVLHDLGGAAAAEGKSVVDKEGGPELPKLWGRLPPAACAAGSGSPRS